MINLLMPDINVDEIIVRKFSENIQRYYVDLPYHNYKGHVLSAIQIFNEIYTFLKHNNIHIDLNLGHLVLYGHDAGYHEDHVALGFDTKEAYSASITKIELEKLDVAEATIVIICNAIMATHVGTQPQTNLETAVCYADIGNIASSEDLFILSFILSIKELIFRSIPLNDSFSGQCHSAQRLLHTLLNRIPDFTRVDGGKLVHETFISKAVRNINSLDNLTINEIKLKYGHIPIALPGTWVSESS